MDSKHLKNAVSDYVKAQALIILVNTLIFWIILSVLNLRFALLFALLTGILSTVPFFGIAASAVMVFIFSLLDGQSFSALNPFFEGLVIILIYIIFNQLIDLFISPLILGKTLKLSPLFIFLAVLAASSMFGIVGMFLAVPAIVLLKALFAAKK